MSVERNGSERQHLSLDDLYRMTAHIYREQNAGRTREATFAHFVEVCGMLSRLDRKKPPGEINNEDALCKALGWFFPLMAQFRVASVEGLVFRKYPTVCPYCRECPHQDRICKTIRGARPGVVDHDRLKSIAATSETVRPSTLDEWQRMFQEIYPRTVEDRPGRSTLGLLEELGELAEAIRVFNDHPKYFAGEAADVFSYLMGIANEHSLRVAQEEDRLLSYEDEFLARYPGMCLDCGSRVCSCPHVPPATVGRMAKELDVDDYSTLFVHGPIVDEGAAKLIAQSARRRARAHPSLMARFPMDRGEANLSIVEICTSLADILHESHEELADSFRSIAHRLSQSTSSAGGRQHSEAAREAVDALRHLYETSPTAREAMDEVDSRDEVGDIAIPKKYQLLVVCSHHDAAGADLKVHSEAQAIQDAIERSKFRSSFETRVVVAGGLDHLRRELLERDVTILHIAGHGTEYGLEFVSGDGHRSIVSVADLADYLRRFASIECLILNACYSLSELDVAVSSVTIGMEDAISSEGAREFARGFYDALGAGRDAVFAADEGRHAARMKGYGDIAIKILAS